MRVVPVSRPARILDGGKAASYGRAALEAERPEAGPAEIGLQDEAVVPRPEEYYVVRGQSALTAFILTDLSRKALV